MTVNNGDETRFATLRTTLFTAVVGDILDSMGRFHQILPPEIRALDPAMTVVGRAMPVLIADVFGHQTEPFGRLTEALDQLDDGDIYLARGGKTPCAAWGEILTATARSRGANGAVIDGYHRDTNGILAQEWPVFSHGAYAQDAGVRSSVIDYRVPVQIGAVSVAPGDLVFGDRDGVIVIPQGIEDEVVERAVAKAETEQEVRQSILSGMSASAAYEAYGVL
jgi:4-hydroxy-4-methyl-2-oxoglutarate aldolase